MNVKQAEAIASDLELMAAGHRRDADRRRVRAKAELALADESIANANRCEALARLRRADIRDYQVETESEPVRFMVEPSRNGRWLVRDRKTGKAKRTTYGSAATAAMAARRIERESIR